MIKDEKFSPILSTNENRSTASLFEARKFYDNISIPYVTGAYLEPQGNLDSLYYDKNDIRNVLKNRVPLADLYNENADHGYLDYFDGDVIAPINDKESFLERFKQVNLISGEKLYLQNFVADAFIDMRNYLNEQIEKNCFGVNNVVIGPNGIQSPFYNISIRKAYTQSNDIDSLYLSNMFVTCKKFKRLAKNDANINSQITDFKSFTIKYMDFLMKHLFISPVTKTRTHCFYNLREFNSGLSFSISDDEAGNYVNNYEKYYMDIAFLNFAKACIRYGFRMDKNNPFILYADIKSPAMKPYLEKYKLTYRTLFSLRYKKLYISDIDDLKSFFLRSYNLFVNNNTKYAPVISTLDSTDFCKVRFKERFPIKSIAEFNKIYDNSFWIRLYVYFKNYELNSNFTQEKFEFIVNTASQYYKFGDIRKSATFINSFFDETKGVHFFDSLQWKNDVLKSTKPPENKIEIKF